MRELSAIETDQISGGKATEVPNPLGPNWQQSTEGILD
jgi:hypothetical protein